MLEAGTLYIHYLLKNVALGMGITLWDSQLSPRVYRRFDIRVSYIGPRLSLLRFAIRT